MLHAFRALLSLISAHHTGIGLNTICTFIAALFAFVVRATLGAVGSTGFCALLAILLARAFLGTLCALSLGGTTLRASHADGVAIAATFCALDTVLAALAHTTLAGGHTFALLLLLGALLALLHVAWFLS